MKSQPSEGNRISLGARQSHSADLVDDDDSLIRIPDTFEDYDELNGDNDATPDDRRLDPLRRSW